MTTAFPAALDAYGDPTGAQVQGGSVPTHSGHHTNHNDAIEALEAKLGIGASVAAVNTVLRGTGAGATAFGQIQTADLAALAVSQVLTYTSGTGLSTNSTSHVDMGAGASQVKVDITTVAGSVLLCFLTAVMYAGTPGGANISLKAETEGDHIGPQPGLAVSNWGFTAVEVRVITGLSAGAHTISARWFSPQAVTINTTGGYSLIVVELRR